MDEGKEDFLNKLALVATLQDVPQFEDMARKALDVYEKAGGVHNQKTQVAILGAASAIAAKLMRDTQQSLFAPSSGVAEFYQARGDSYEALTAYQAAQKDLVSRVEAMLSANTGRTVKAARASKDARSPGSRDGDGAAFVPAMYTGSAAAESKSGSRNGESVDDDADGDPRKGSFEWVRQSWQGWNGADDDRDKYLACLFDTTSAKVKMIADENENDFDTIVDVLLKEHGEPDDDRGCAKAAADADPDDVEVEVVEDDDDNDDDDGGIGLFSWLTSQ